MEITGIAAIGAGLAAIGAGIGIGKMGTDQNVLTQEFWDDIRQRVFESGVDFGRAHEELSILWHAKRLVSFYQKVTN